MRKSKKDILTVEMIRKLRDNARIGKLNPLLGPIVKIDGKKYYVIRKKAVKLWREDLIKKAKSNSFFTKFLGKE